MAKQKGLAELYSKYKDRSTFDSELDQKFISTGSVMIDQVLSKGKGMPSGSWIQLTADSGTGKTHIVLQIAKVICSKGKKVMYIDSEKGVNSDQLNKLGLVPYLGTSFFLMPISTFEEAEECMDAALADPDIALIVIDSVTQLIPKKCLEQSISNVEPGLKARFTGAFMEKYKAQVSYTEAKPSVILLNQKRVKFEGWQASVKEAGGNAQKFMNDLRLSMSRKEWIDDEKTTFSGKQKSHIGAKCEIWAEKNRYSDPFIKWPVVILFGKGVSNLYAYKELLEGQKVLTMSGAGFWKMTLPGDEERKCRGEEACIEMLKENLPRIKEYVNSIGGFDALGSDTVEDGDNSITHIDLGDELEDLVIEEVE